MSEKRISGSVPSSPSFRAMAMNTVAIVPLMASSSSFSSVSQHPKNSYSLKSFEILMDSLERYANHRAGGKEFTPNISSQPIIRSSSCPKERDDDESSKHPKEIKIIIPNDQLTRPGDWRYDTSPLRSHAWNLGCQRMICFDGRDSFDADFPANQLGTEKKVKISDLAKDRSPESKCYHSFSDLYPSRGTSAVIGVLSVRDCESLDSLRAAEKELAQWADRYTLKSYRNQVGSCLIQGTNGESTDYFPTIIQRMFIFDSFDEATLIKMDLSQTHLFRSGELIAFPPSGTAMMDLHLNVVVNDLAVAIFLALEERIRACDGNKTKVSVNARGALTAPVSLIPKGGSSVSNNDAPVGPSERLGISSLVTLVGPGASDPENSSNGSKGSSFETKTDDDESNFSSSIISMASSAVKALNAYKGMDTSEYLFFTPIDARFIIDKLSSKDMEYLLRRNSGRREKFAADLCLLAGSPMDAYERYTRAADLSKRNQDPLFYAASLEGCAASFVAMSDVGGHGVDDYLDENFQYPDDIMALIIANQQLVGDTKDTKVDRTKTTMPAAVTALMEEALLIVRCHVLLSPIFSEMALKLAWYTSELEESHLRCRWGEGCYEGLDSNRPNQFKRWQKSSVAKFKLEELRSKGLFDPILSVRFNAQCLKFCDLLHKATSTCGLDPFTRSQVALTCVKMCLVGVKATYWSSTISQPSISNNTFMRTVFNRKAAYFASIAADAYTYLGDEVDRNLVAQIWLSAAVLYSKEANTFRSRDKYAWASIRATILHALTQRRELLPTEHAIRCLLQLLTEMSVDENPAVKDAKSQMDSSNASLQRRGSAFNEVNNEQEVEFDSVNKISKKENARRSNITRSRFTVQGAAAFVYSQCKWLDDDPVPMMPLPFVEPSQILKLLKEDLKAFPSLRDMLVNGNRFSTITALNCALPLRRSECTAISESRMDFLVENIGYRLTSHSMPMFQVDSVGRPPCSIVAVDLLPSYPHLLLDRVKVGTGDKLSNQSPSKAVFFNPFAKEKSTDNMYLHPIQIIEGEERVIEITFDNNLLVTLDVQHCKLLFDCVGTSFVESTEQSFLLPPKTKTSTIRFPFLLIPSSLRKTQVSQESGLQETFKLVGLRMSCLRRSYDIRFDSEECSLIGSVPFSGQIPEPLCIYGRSRHHLKSKKQLKYPHTFEPIPAQPYLYVSVPSLCSCEVQDGFTIPIEIADGEFITGPFLEIMNLHGRNDDGRIHRIQIIASGLPHSQEQLLYDSDSLVSQDDSNISAESNSCKVVDRIETAQPLTMWCTAKNLSIESLNSSTSVTKVSFGFRASFVSELCQPDLELVKVRFRYRGSYSKLGMEFWRKKEIHFRIMTAKGPRISSFSLCPHLSMKSANAMILSSQSSHLKNLVLCSDDVFVAVIGVVNDTTSNLILSNRSRKARTLSGERLSHIFIAPGAIMMIPIVLPRVICNSKGSASLLAELSQLSAFDWESDSVNCDELSCKNVLCSRRGTLVLPRKLIDEVDLSGRCKLIELPPVNVSVTARNFVVDSVSALKPGSIVDVSAVIKFSDWFHQCQAPNFAMILDFFCSRNDTESLCDRGIDFVWCGQTKCVERTVVNRIIHHPVRICFLNRGRYIISAHVRLSGYLDDVVWLAEEALNIEIV